MIEYIRRRRSIRKFKQQKIKDHEIEILKEALLRSPTSRNRRPWEFIIIDDPSTISTLSKAKPHGLTFMKTAPLAVVVCGREKESDVWIEDCSIASMLLQLTAQSMGLGSCWGQIRLREHDETESAEQFIRHHLNIPETIRVESIIGIGYPDEEKSSLPLEDSLNNKIHVNRYKSE